VVLTEYKECKSLGSGNPWCEDLCLAIFSGILHHHTHGVALSGSAGENFVISTYQSRLQTDVGWFGDNKRNNVCSINNVEYIAIDSLWMALCSKGSVGGGNVIIVDVDFGVGSRLL